MVIARSSSGYLNYTATSSSVAFDNVSGDFMLAFITNQGGSNDIIAPTYNSVTMTEIGTAVQEGTSGRYLHAYYLKSPATGSHTFASSRSSSADTWCVFVTYSGTNTTTQPDNSTTQQFASPINTATTSLTTVADNCWAALMCQGARDFNASTGSTFVVNNTSGSFELYDSNAALTPAGSKSMAVTQSPDSAAACTFMVSIAPQAASGPANLKSYNTNVKANIKSIDTNLVANIKSLNTNT